jgi:tetratricopeptide (TPR) repeat protein
MLYLKGRHYWNERSDEGVSKAIDYFKEAINKDPGFALGYSGLADCYQVMGRNEMAESGPSFEKAKGYATKALEMDENLAEAHTTLAAVTLALEYDWERSEKEFRRAIELKPSYSTAHQWYAHLLNFQGRFTETSAEIGRALELDPLSLVINVNFGDGLYYLKHYDAAIEQFKKTIDMEPSFPSTYLSLIQVCLRKGMYEEALRAVETYTKLTKYFVQEKLSKAYVYAAMGKSEESRGLLEDVERDYQLEHLSPYNIALVRFLLGDKNEGFEWLGKAFETHDANILALNIDVELDGFKDDSRFTDLLRRIGLARTSKNAGPLAH